MQNNKKCGLYALFMSELLKLLLLTTLATTAFAAVQDASVKVAWGYKGNTGPAHWGELDPSFALCAEGKAQTPINIPKRISTTFENRFIVQYQSALADIVDDGTTKLIFDNIPEVVNTGHSVQVNFPKASIAEQVIFNKHPYRLVQFHFHTPGENALAGQTFPLEIHFVHQGSNGKVLVLAVFAKGGAANAEIQKIIDHLPKENGDAHAVRKQHINPANLITNSISYTYYTFLGSLTTPPCTEGLQWVVIAEPITVSPAQLLQLRRAAGDGNARPLQPLGKRNINKNQYEKPRDATT